MVASWKGSMGDGVPICSSVHSFLWQEHIFECINLFRWSCRYPWKLNGWNPPKITLNFLRRKMSHHLPTIHHPPPTHENLGFRWSSAVNIWGLQASRTAGHFHLPTWVFQTSGRSTDLPAVSILLITSFRKFLGWNSFCPRVFFAGIHDWQQHHWRIIKRML